MKKILVSVLLCFLFSGIWAQQLQAGMDSLAKGYQPEKVYIHYDKSSYVPGETIWFKAYMLEGIYPALASKTLYVDYVGESGNVLGHIVSPLMEGNTFGQFEIPSDYNGSLIHVRAYTKWMLNFDTAFLYSKDLRVLGITNAKPVKTAIVSELNFFPEGGSAVASLPNKIAFKANDQYGTPVRIKGVVTDNSGKLIDSLRVLHDGMGFINMQPEKGVTYVAKWKDEKGSDHTTPLPAAKEEGITMQVGINGSKRIVSVYSNVSAERQGTLHLVGNINQNLVFKSDVTLTENIARKVIPTENLPSGILTITLFDQDWKEVAERITFINNNDYSFETSLEVKNWGLSKRKRNEILLSIPDSMQSANLSVSVTDVAIEKDTTETIISRFLLSSDIRGRVYNPAYYFRTPGSIPMQHLDLVMLTNGWRKISWQQVLKGTLPPLVYKKDSSYLTLSGQVFGVSKSQLTGNENIILMIKEKDSATKMVVVPIKRDATFQDDDLIIFDTLQVYYSLKSKFLSQAEARFMTEKLPAPNYTTFSKNFATSTGVFDTSGLYYHTQVGKELTRLQDIERGKMMENITVMAKQKTTIHQMDEKYASGLFRGEDGYQFDLVNDANSFGYNNVFSYLQGKVAGLQINNSNPPVLSWRGGTPTVYLDEMRTEPDMIQNIPVGDVAYIKVFRPPFAIMGDGGGAIVIYTKKGNDAATSSKKGLNSNVISGYTKIKEFYSPNYDRFDVRNEKQDIRTTLYWNPSVVTKKGNGKVTLQFYNNDITGSFRIVVEGMTKDGLLTHFEQIIE